MYHDYYQEQCYLQHYGRKGMKWYQHIFGKENKNNRRENRRYKKDKDYKKYREWHKQYKKNARKNGVKRKNIQSADEYIKDKIESSKKYETEQSARREGIGKKNLSKFSKDDVKIIRSVVDQVNANGYHKDWPEAFDHPKILKVMNSRDFDQYPTDYDDDWALMWSFAKSGKTSQQENRNINIGDKYIKSLWDYGDDTLETLEKKYKMRG